MALLFCLRGVYGFRQECLFIFLFALICFLVSSISETMVEDLTWEVVLEMLVITLAVWVRKIISTNVNWGTELLSKKKKKTHQFSFFFNLSRVYSGLGCSVHGRSTGSIRILTSFASH